MQHDQDSTELQQAAADAAERAATADLVGAMADGSRSTAPTARGRDLDRHPRHLGPVACLLVTVLAACCLLTAPAGASTTWQPGQPAPAGTVCWSAHGQAFGPDDANLRPAGDPIIPCGTTGGADQLGAYRCRVEPSQVAGGFELIAYPAGMPFVGTGTVVPCSMPAAVAVFLHVLAVAPAWARRQFELAELLGCRPGWVAAAYPGGASCEPAASN